MHFELLVEDRSGKEALDILVPKIVGNNHTYKIHSYKGLGGIPKNLQLGAEAKRQGLLNSLPGLLRGYGKTFAAYPDGYQVSVIVVCDLDDQCRETFLGELNEVLDNCDPKPDTRFCLAIEEGEAWLLGDANAIRAAYPNAKDAVLNAYVNDSVCGTWEVLANAVYHGGCDALKKKGMQKVGQEKTFWARNICPHMNVVNNASPSFNHFRDRLLELIQGQPSFGD